MYNSFVSQSYCKLLNKIREEIKATQLVLFMFVKKSLWFVDSCFDHIISSVHEDSDSQNQLEILIQKFLQIHCSFALLWNGTVRQCQIVPIDIK